MSSDREVCTIESKGGITLDARIYRPAAAAEPENPTGELVAVLVHPYSVLGGCQGLMRGIARRLAERGVAAMTFDMRGVGRSTGRASITGFAEVDDVVSVCKWASQNLTARRIVLIGSSAGAPIAGSALDKIDEVIGYVSLGYPFGFIASILFGRHHKAVLQSPKPKLFVMGTRDGFTSVKQLESKLKNAAGHNQIHLIEGVNHFQMEGPAYDEQMANVIVEFISSL
ncbi:alpha/beta-Hydrolases superfamily protein [Striga asiatica]|uniref:Alpha/beta-Hydrolases superfamily protein n=1 Tax=Striga asiatica TaxID=4170 RepID=A0A5A7RIY7_STRAF|nr:alpha/beta-Hydrolases superfamily protein [Striga asiatica]